MELPQKILKKEMISEQWMKLECSKMKEILKKKMHRRVCMQICLKKKEVWEGQTQEDPSLPGMESQKLDQLSRILCPWATNFLPIHTVSPVPTSWTTWVLHQPIWVTHSLPQPRLSVLRLYILQCLPSTTHMEVWTNWQPGTKCRCMVRDHQLHLECLHLVFLLLTLPPVKDIFRQGSP